MTAKRSHLGKPRKQMLARVIKNSQDEPAVLTAAPPQHANRFDTVVGESRQHQIVPGCTRTYTPNDEE